MNQGSFNVSACVSAIMAFSIVMMLQGLTAISVSRRHAFPCNPSRSRYARWRPP